MVAMLSKFTVFIYFLILLFIFFLILINFVLKKSILLLY